MPRLKKVLSWLVVLGLALIVACVVLLAFRDPLLRRYVANEIRNETGVEANFGSFKVGLKDGSLHITDFKLQNPPGFGDAPLLRMPELYVRVDREAVAEGKLRFHEARVNIGELQIIRNAAGETNIMLLQEHAKSRPKKKRRRFDDEVSFGGIGELRVTLGKVRYIDMQNLGENRDFLIDIKDEAVTTIKTEKDLETWAKGLFVRIAVQQLLKETQQRKFPDLRIEDQVERENAK
ncbi:MAG: AsmA family protein [Verrucomicrobia subdivision 3 bacterium]|nr:AsmA family protein [Limisphaerales bacterium]